MSDHTPESAAKELLARRLAHEKLSSYREYMARSEHVDYIYPPEPHHALIVEALQGLYERRYTRLLIMAPPGSAKSTYSSIQFVTWYMSLNPSHQVLTCSNTQDLAERFNKRRRASLETLEWRTLSGTSLDPAAKSAADFHTSEGGSCRAAGVGSSITGLRSDLSVIDDPIVGFEQSLSSDILEKMWNWYVNDYRTRAKPTTLELLIMTRWARGDLAGRILDLIDSGREKGWHVIRLPLECDSHDDPLGRDMGQLLWPQWYGSRVEEFRRDPISWECLHQQNPIDAKGTWVPTKHINVCTRTRDKCTLKWVMAIDLALTTGGGDYSVIMMAGLDRERRLHIDEIWRERVATPQVAKKVIDLYQEYEPVSVLIDNDTGSKVFSTLMYEMCREYVQPVPLTLVPTRGRSKEVRAAAVRGLFFHNRILIAKDQPWTSGLLREIADFPSGKNDDQIDCLSLVGQHMIKMTPQRVNSATKKIPDAVLNNEIQEINGQFVSPYTLDGLFKDNEPKRRKFEKLRIG